MKTPKNSITQKMGRFARLNRLTLASLIALPTLAATAANLHWSGGTADYTNAADWVGGAVPGAADAAINDNTTNNVVQINAGDPDWSVSEIVAGDGAGSDGAFVQNGQNVFVSGTNYNDSVVTPYYVPFRLGVAAGFTGVYTLNGGTLNYTNAGSFNIGELGAGILNINGGSINGNGNFADNLGIAATPTAVTATVGGNVGESDYTWYEQGFSGANPSLGLPVHNSTITSISLPDHIYTMPPSYATNDAVMIASNVPNATITLASPMVCSNLSLLGSAGNGPVVVNYTVHHADSSTETGSISVPDWFGPAANTNMEVLPVGGRVDALGVTFQTPGTANGLNGNAPFLFSLDLALTNYASAVDSIDLAYVSAGNINSATCLLGISGQSPSGGDYVPLAMTGYNEDMVIGVGEIVQVAGTVTDVVNQTNGAVAVTGAGQMFVGNYGTGIYNLSGGSIDVHNYIAIGRSGGNGTFNMTGGALNQDGGGNLLVGSGFNAPSGGSAVGVLNQSGGAITCQGLFLCPESSPSSGTYNLGGTGTLTVNNTLEIGTAGDVGILNQTGGSITNLSGQTWIGQGAGAVGAYNLSGGTFTASSWLAVGRTTGSGTINLTNGAITYNGPSNQHFDVGASGAGVLNQYGGAITNTTSDFWLGETSTATWNMYGGSATLGNLVICVDSSAAGTLNLNGGLIQAAGITTGNSVAVSTLNFNGGTLQANANNTSFLSGLFQALVGNGGAVIDSQGYSLTIAQPLLNNGSGGLTKYGTGTLTLTGANTYAGNTLVNAGTVFTGTGSSASGNVTVADNAGFGVIVQTAGAQYTAANVTLGSSAGAALNFNLGAFGNPSLAQAPLSVSTSLTINGTITVNVADALSQLGDIPLVQYPPGGLAGVGSFVKGSLPAGVTATIVTNSANNSIDLVITGINQPRWDGEAGGTWDTGSDTNWVNLGTGLATTYTDPSPVVFNDSALGTTNVNLTTTVNPSGITVTNNVLNYAILGAGTISGPTGLAKSGSGSLAILNPGGNNFTGPVTLSGGTLNVTNLANGGSPSAIGASSANPTNLVLAGGTFSYSGPAVSINRGYALRGSSVLNVQSNLTLTGLAQATSGTLYKTGAGTQTYAGVGTNVLSTANVGGAYQVLAGTVVFNGSAGAQTNYEIGQMFVGSATNSAANLILTNTSLGSSDWFALGRGNGNSGFLSTASVYNSVLSVSYLDPGTASSGGGVSLGYANGLPNAASQVLSLYGTSSLINYGGNFNLAENAGSSAVVNVTNSAFIVSGGSRNYIGDAAGKAVLNLNSTATSTFSTNGGQIFLGGTGGTTDSGAGALNLSAGALKFGNGTGVYIMLGDNGGTAPTSYGSFVQSGGLLNMTSGDGIRVGYGGWGSFVQNGGTLLCGRYLSIGGNTTGGNGVVTFTGGTAGIFNTGYRILLPDAAATGVFNLGTEAGGTAIFTNLYNSGGSSLIMVNTAGGNGTLNLNSGTLQLGGAVHKQNTGTAVANLNGGALQAGANNLTLLDTSLNSLNVFNGGLTVDTMGNSATVSGNLLATFGNGIYPAGGILVVTNNGGAGYLGAPLVTVSGGSGSGALAIATVSGGVVTNVVLTCPGQNYVAGDVLTFAFSGGGAVTAAGSFVHTLQAGDLAANGSGGLTKISNGTLYLTGTSTYTGATLVNAGTLSGATTIYSPVTVASGATLAVGSSPTTIGTFTINNTVSMAAGSTNFMKINPTGGTKDLLTGMSQVTYGGTLVISNQAGALANGNSFKLYNATFYNGAFSAIVPATPGTNLIWNTNQLTVSGTLLVASAVTSSPTNIQARVSGGNLVVSGGNGTPGTGYTVLTTTNLATPVINWITNVQGTIGTDGTFTNTIPIVSTNPAQFFRLRTP
jgi:autotransporter-associated beta strand protein